MKTSVRRETSLSVPQGLPVTSICKTYGLCSTCRTASECVFPRDPERPILHCDEFDPAPPMPAAHPRSIARPAAANPEPVRGKVRGLCATCDLAEGCTYPRPEGGVWHCEEYR